MSVVKQRIRYDKNRSLFEQFKGQFKGKNVIPFTSGTSPQKSAHFTQYRCRLLLIDGDLYSFKDLAKNRRLNPHKIKANTLEARHRKGYNTELLFASSDVCLSLAAQSRENKKLNIIAQKNKNPSLFEYFSARLNGIQVIPYTYGRSTKTEVSVHQSPCRLLLINGDLYSFEDLANNKQLNPHALTAKNLRVRHKKGLNTSCFFDSSTRMRSTQVKKGIKKRKSPKAHYCPPVKSFLERERLSRYGSDYNRHLNAFLSPALANKYQEEGVL